MSKPRHKNDRWKKISVPLDPGHKWQCKPGNQLFIADRGAVTFEFPQGWVVRHDQVDTITLHDRAPPDDSARVSLTIFRLPPVEGGWSQLPLNQMLKSKPAQDDEDRGEMVVHDVARPGMEMIWGEKQPYPDPENGKLIRCRHVLARARGIQALISFDVYVDADERFAGAWDDLLLTLQLGIPRNIQGEAGN
jgi:hypothetical protein